VGQCGNRGGPATELFGDLCGGPFFDGGHPQRLLPIRRERRERVGDEPGFRQALRIFEHRAIALEQRRIGADRPAAPAARLAAVANAGHQILAEVRAWSGTVADGGDHSGECLVDDIVGVVTGAEDVAGDVASTVLVPAVQLLERPVIVARAARELDEIVVSSVC